jgi:hypothetical protein
VQDAFNLGWKLAAVVAGRMPASFLDSYQDERHPVGALVVDNTRAQTALRGPGPEHVALREIFKRMLEIPDAARFIGGMIAGTSIDYGGSGHVGQRLPDFRIGAGWASDLFHTGRGVFIARHRRDLHPASPWMDRIESTLVDNLPWTDVDAVLVRPDGYVCWTAPGNDLLAALKTWFGDPDRSSRAQAGKSRPVSGRLADA